VKVILSAKGKLIARTSVFQMSIEDTNSGVVKLQKIEYDKGIRDKLGPSVSTRKMSLLMM
jgi:hypothetical protein